MSAVRVIMTWTDQDERPRPTAVVPDGKDSADVELHWRWLEARGWTLRGGRVWFRNENDLYGQVMHYAAVSDPMEVQR